jgi:hypothetical protein
VTTPTGCAPKPRTVALRLGAVLHRDQWLDQLPTNGALTQFTPDKLAEVLDCVGAAIDTIGGSFTMTYTTLAATARTSAI